MVQINDDVAVHQILNDSSNNDLNSLSDFDNVNENKSYNPENSSNSNEKSNDFFIFIII